MGVEDDKHRQEIREIHAKYHSLVYDLLVHFGIQHYRCADGTVDMKYLRQDLDLIKADNRSRVARLNLTPR